MGQITEPAYKIYVREQSGYKSYCRLRDFDEIDFGQGDSDIIFADLDHDGDGKINFEDFRSVLNMIFTYFDLRQKILILLVSMSQPVHKRERGGVTLLQTSFLR